MSKTKVDFPHLDHVEGWLDTKALLFTSYCASNIVNVNSFDSLEIGVYHGKFLIGIENLTPYNSRCIAIDCFSQQEANIDLAGYGNLEKFAHNYKKFSLNPKRVMPVEIDSLKIDPHALGKRKFGIISIDACHTEKHTKNDLSIAEVLVMDDGVVILDDISNEDWMGVVSGAYNFFTTASKGHLVPFAVGFNKLFCCTAKKKQQAIDLVCNDASMRNDIGIYAGKITEFAGHKIVVLK